MFKALGNLLYKTPWWAMVLTGLFTFLVLALFTVPFNVLRLAESGKSSTENRAIQREIDRSFGDGALTIAERVVRSMAERTSDPARKAEFSQALKEIASVRADLSSAENDVKNAKADAAQAAKDAAEDARRAAKDAEREMQQQAREAALSDRDDAREKIAKLRDARADAVSAQKRVGLNDQSAFAAYDKAIAEAKKTKKDADEILKKIKKGSYSMGLGRKDGETESITGPLASSSLNAPQIPPAPPAPPKADKPVKSPASVANGSPDQPKVSTLSLSRDGTNQTGQPNDLTVSSKDDRVNIDGWIAGTRIKGDIAIGDIEKTLNKIDAATVGPVTPSLTPELREDIRRRVSNDFRRLGIGSALIVSFIPIFFILIILKFYIGRSRRALDVASVKTKEAESANVNRQIVEAKLMVLQAQVEPHFLYNTLANVQALTEVDPVQANKMTGHLIQYLRASLPKMRENISTVGQEIELVRAYLNILKMRMGPRLEFGIDVSGELETLPFPPLMLPSLVENAIKHGLEPLREGGRIDVVAEKTGVGKDAKLRLMIKDTGKGLTDSPVQSGGIGLNNIRERLRALFGEHARLILQSNSPTGVIATIEAPASGASAFMSASVADSLRAEEPKTWGAKTLKVAAKTHSAWAAILVKIFIGIVAVLGVLFVVGMIGLATDAIPMHIGNASISGIEGMAIGTVVFLLAFGILSIVALILVAVLYGLGFLFVGLAIAIPLMILVSLFPVLAPFIFVGFLVYWFWWRKKKNTVIIKPPNA